LLFVLPDLLAMALSVVVEEIEMAVEYVVPWVQLPALAVGVEPSAV